MRNPISCSRNLSDQTGEKGYKVAICEQVEDPKLAKGMVKREVTRVVTPGTTLNAQALDETKIIISCVSHISVTIMVFLLQILPPETIM